MSIWMKEKSSQDLCWEIGQLQKTNAAGKNYTASHSRIIAKALPLLCRFRKLPLPRGYAGRSAETMRELSRWRQGSRGVVSVNPPQTCKSRICVLELWRRGAWPCPCCWLATCLYNVPEVPFSAICSSDGGSSVFCKGKGQRSCWLLDALELVCRYLTGTGAP